MTEEDLDPWLEKEIWRILRTFREELKRRDDSKTIRRASVQDIYHQLIPASNTLKDLTFRREMPVWGCKSAEERKSRIKACVDNLLALHRLTPPGTEKISRYTSLLELEVLESLSRL